MYCNIEEKKENELMKLSFYQNTCERALNELALNHPNQLTEFEKEKIYLMLKRLFNSEVDYLISSPENYFALYEDE